jgi:hypothetical protein
MHTPRLPRASARPAGLATGPLVAALVVLACAPLQAATIDLASTMRGMSFLSEDAVTGAFARIGAGDGALGSAGANTGDADGLYALANIGSADPGASVGTPIDLFPRETNFAIGSLTYDGAGLVGAGVETFVITGLDLGAFWSADPSRLDGAAGVAPTVVSDLSDAALGVWFFNAAGGLAFGPLDAADTVTFTDGVLTSIDLVVGTEFSVEAFGALAVWSGVFAITGAEISYQIDDTALVGGFIPSRLVADLTGTVNAVAVVPEPASATLLAGGLALAGVALRRRRRA